MGFVDLNLVTLRVSFDISCGNAFEMGVVVPLGTIVQQ